MTHTICNQAKPSLSVRTRALTSKHLTTKSINRWRLIRTSTSLRLRHRNAAPFHKTDDTTADHVYPTQSDALVSTNCTNELQNCSIVTGQSLPAFPANGSYFVSSESSSASSTSSNHELLACKWEGCQTTDIERAQLVNHLHQIHVLPQVCNRRKYFACLWRGCRVFKQPSVSATWLEQHILHHTDAKGKPFRCIFDACSMRFSSSTLLERHVQRTHIRVTRAQTTSLTTNAGGLASNLACPAGQNGQFNLSNSLSTSPMSKPSDLATSMVRKNVRRRKRLRGYRVRRIDFYDNRTRTVIQNRLKIIRLLSSRLDPDTMVNSSIELETLLPSNLPSKLSELSNSSNNNNNNKPRLRSSSFANSTINNSNNNHSNNKLSSTPKSDHDNTPTIQTSMASRRKNISLLLTIPHTFVGQRLCEDQRTEFLVRWTGGSAHDSIPPTWILEDELLNAIHLERQL